MWSCTSDMIQPFRSKRRQIIQILCPRQAHVIVPAHHMQWSDGRQLIEDVPATDVARVNDSLTALQSRNGFGAKRTIWVSEITPTFPCVLLPDEARCLTRSRIYLSHQFSDRFLAIGVAWANTAQTIS